MQAKNEFPDHHELRALLKGEVNSNVENDLISRIRNHLPYDEFSSGVKDFLEQNQYNLKAMQQWRGQTSERVAAKIKSDKGNRKGWNLTIKVAASILILISGVYMYYAVKRTANVEWKAYYNSDPGLPVFMGVNSTNSWMQYYRAEKYALALNEINLNLEQSPANDTLLYYRLVCLFETGLLNPDSTYSMTKQNESLHLDNGRRGE